MIRVKLITASFGYNKKKLDLNISSLFDNYTITSTLYDNNNTDSRENSLYPITKEKIPKMMEWVEHPDYDYYIWKDAGFILTSVLLKKLLSNITNSSADLFLFSHPDRSSIKEEMGFMIEEMKYTEGYLYRKYGGEILEDQVGKCLVDKDYNDNKLFYTGLFIYSKKLIENKDANLMTDWFMHCILYNTQDQLWLPYLVNRHKVNYVCYPSYLLQ